MHYQKLITVCIKVRLQVGPSENRQLLAVNLSICSVRRRRRNQMQKNVQTWKFCQNIELLGAQTLKKTGIQRKFDT